MINKAMFVDQNELNDFTKLLKARCELFGGDDVLMGKEEVQLRNGSTVEVTYALGDEEDPESGMFKSEGCLVQWGVWNLDGSSLTNADYDIIGM
jgi:hypothetical protein